MTDALRDVSDALGLISDHWQPRRVTNINDYDVKVVKLQGDFVSHTHPERDELFMVRTGQLAIQPRVRNVHLGPDDALIVPAVVEHCPRADQHVSALLFEPKGTVNTGDVGGDRTAALQKFWSTIPSSH